MKRLCIALIVFMGLTGLAFAQSDKDAYKSLKKVEARVQTGVSYRDYPQVIADARAEVNLFLESKAAKKDPQFTLHVKKAMDYYMKAGEIWGMQFIRNDLDVKSKVHSDFKT